MRGHISRFVVVLAFGLGLTGVGCETGEGGGQGQGPGRRNQPLALTPQQELSLGEKAYQDVLAKAHVERDGRDVAMVRRVGEKIARASQIEPLQREINLHIKDYKFAWEFNVLDDKQVNAFCLPGGKVAVFSELLKVVENEDQLAVVLGHEIAHALAHHSSERLAHEKMTERALQVANGALGSLAPEEQRRLIGLLAAGAQVHSLSYDRDQESEADHIGIFLTTFAGYDPEQALPFWQRMEELGAKHGRPPTILSDHPSDAKRIAQLKAWIPAAKAAKQAYDQGRVAPAH